MSDREPQPERGGDRDHRPRATPRVWVGSLADYNNGRLHGEWINADQSAEELDLAIRWMLASAPTPDAEEWGIFDFDGFTAIRIDEHEDLETVSKLAHGIKEHGIGFAIWAELVDKDLHRLDQFEDAYLGVYDSREAYAEHLLDDIGVPERIEGLPDWLQPYIEIDYQSLSDAMWISGDISFADHGGKVWVFDGRI